MHFTAITAIVLAILPASIARRSPQPNLQARHSSPENLVRRGVPAAATNVSTLITPQNVTIRYKQPGLEGICETTPGVKSYSGYIDLDENTHSFFWFFEARHKPEEAPITLWLNGGPGSDSQIGLFQELGPCKVLENLTTTINPYSWSEVSNLLFLSQPLGVGFSYGHEQEGTENQETGQYENASFAGVDGRYPIANSSALDTTDLCAVAAWHVLQGFLGGLPQLDSKIVSREFHLWTESYGGHYGTSFYNYFYEQTQLILNGSTTGIVLDFASLGIGNGIIDVAIQYPSYPKFANFNQFGIKAVNDTVYDYMMFALNKISGCLDQLKDCASLNLTTNSDVVVNVVCSEADNMCGDNVENPYYAYSGRGAYDIRQTYNESADFPNTHMTDFLNLASTQNALGVDLNYTGQTSYEVNWAFATTGDDAWPNFLIDLNHLLDKGLRVHLYYGDADFICNWFGGEAISLAVNYTHTEEFRAAGYTPFLVDSTEYGAVRQYGNFSFLRMYEAGHLVPSYQPEASLEMFRRVVGGLDVATGEVKFGPGFSTNGTANSTHTESAPPLPTMTSSSTTSGGMMQMTSAPRWE